ncbi:hypothetical protein T06_14940, partial [Trichinella sp. T6]
MQLTHKYHINTALTGTCIKQPFTILYMLNITIEVHVGNAYIDCILKIVCNSHLCKKPLSLTACDRNANQK